MTKIEKNSIGYLILLIIAISVAGIIIWPLLDLLFHAVFTQSEFVYSPTEHIIEPIIFGIIAGVVFWIFDKKADAKNQRKKLK